MKVPIITDTHFGVRNDHPAFLDSMKKFFENVFWVTVDDLRALQGDTIIIDLGDTFDRRKHVNFHTLDMANKFFFQPMKNRYLDYHHVVGNHNAYYKNNNDITSVEQLYRDTSKFNFYPRVQDVDIAGRKVCFIPWIARDDAEEAYKRIKESRSQVAMGHLEIRGALKRRGFVAEKGMEPSLLSKFSWVLSGHFHHGHKKDNVHFLGSVGQYDWSDHEDVRGFWIWDTEDDSFQFLENPYKMFEKVFYDDEKEEEALKVPENLEGKFVKLVVKNKKNPFLFDRAVEKLEKTGLKDLQVVDDHHHLDQELDDEITKDAEDTLTVLKKVIDQTEMSADRQRVAYIMESLYHEAQSIE